MGQRCRRGAVVRFRLGGGHLRDSNEVVFVVPLGGVGLAPAARVGGGWGVRGVQTLSRGSVDDGDEADVMRQM